MPRYPYVAQGVCYGAAGAEPIAIGTPVWSAWIKEHTSFTYRDAPLSFTARREERPSGTYWYAYKRTHGKLRKRYLGRGDDLTLQRLQEVAQSLLEQREDIAAQPEAPSLIATRFAIPRSAAEWVPRPQLLQRFSRAIERPCTIITAPAGSGKTTLLAMACEQLREQGWRIAWLSLERSERDPARFWRYALTAIERAAPGAASSAPLPVRPAARSAACRPHTSQSARRSSSR
jgi:LuxR family maltose regulon positive regulatory protein